MLVPMLLGRGGRAGFKSALARFGKPLEAADMRDVSRFQRLYRTPSDGFSPSRPELA